jgi:hypothetical protein
VEFLGDEVCNKDLTMQVLGQVREGQGDKGRVGAGRLLVALYDDGGAGASASDEDKTNGKPSLFLSDPDFQEPTDDAGADAQSGATASGALSAASPWGTRFTWGSSGNLKSLGSTSEGDAAGTATGSGADSDTGTGDAEFIALQRSVSEMSLGDIIAAEEAAAAAALKSPIHTGSKATSSSSSSNGGGGERVVSVNEKVLMEGLARLSRSATRLLPRGSSNNSNNNSNSNGASSSSDGGSGGGGGVVGKRVPRPPSLTPLATALYEHMLEAQATARRTHLNMYRYGDPPESDDERDKDRDVKGKDKK